MGQSIAVMNTKGGVGKSTIVMALAEALSANCGRNVLVIDSDSQTSMSIMLMQMARWEIMERQRHTLVDYLSNMVMGSGNVDWKNYVAPDVSDVEEARSVYLVPSHMNLSLFEREVSAERRHGHLRGTIRGLLQDAKRYFDVILIDCPPGLSVLTECWLREADHYLPPTKPDYLSVRGLSILKRFRELSLGHGFSELIGVLVNLKDDRSPADEAWHRALLADQSNRCFGAAIPLRPYIQRAADFSSSGRTYAAKYPGDAGKSIGIVVGELIERLADFEAGRQAVAPEAPTQAPAEAAHGAVTASAAQMRPIGPREDEATYQIATAQSDLAEEGMDAVEEREEMVVAEEWIDATREEAPQLAPESGPTLGGVEVAPHAGPVPQPQAPDEAGTRARAPYHGPPEHAVPSENLGASEGVQSLDETGSRPADDAEPSETGAPEGLFADGPTRRPDTGRLG